MNVPPEISEWLVDKLERHPWRGGRELRTVTHEFKRNTGGMIVRAGLTASIRPAETCSVSYPSGPEAAMFIPGVLRRRVAFAWASKETTELLLRWNESYRDVGP